MSEPLVKTVPPEGSATDARPAIAGAEPRGRSRFNVVSRGSLPETFETQQAAAPPETAAGARRRPPWHLLSFAAAVLLPTFLAGVYYFAIAAEQYVSEFRFSLRYIDQQTKGEAPGMLSGFAAASAIGLDSSALVQYIRSRELVDTLEPQLGIRRIYATGDADRLARLDPTASIERLVDYWQGMIDPFFDMSTGLVTVRVRAFAAQDAQRIAEAVLASSEKLVNEMSARAYRDSVRFSEEEVRRAEARLRTALLGLRTFRDKERVVDPRKAAEQRLFIAAKLREELARANADLATMRSQMQSTSPSVRTGELRVSSLEAELRRIEAELLRGEEKSTTGAPDVMSVFETLEVEVKFAEKAYASAHEALEKARAKADRQLVYVATYVRPGLAEEALYPRRWRSVLIVFMCAFGIWCIGSLLFYSVRDHMS